jgi:hypothetical protein
MLAIQWIKDRDKMLQDFHPDGEVVFKFHSESFTDKNGVERIRTIRKFEKVKS